MNEKNNILDSWITIEQLSEGTINKVEKKLLKLSSTPDSWKTVLSEFSFKQIQFLKKSDKSGIVLYFDIFNFQTISTILQDKYNISLNDEEISNTDKFTFAIYFDKELQFNPDKIFLTASGYIRHRKKFPSDLLILEKSIGKKLEILFKHYGFNKTLSIISQIVSKDIWYGFVQNLETDDVNLHSFFISDLLKAKHIRTENLHRYFNEFADVRYNLNTKDSTSDEKYIFNKILQPLNYPLGRFPSNPEYALSLMQQTAVNLILESTNDIQSVNGPPGTGKTTLLKDIFADLIVQQASEITQLRDKNIKGSLVYKNPFKLGCLPTLIADKNIVVASSNNGAVQNIVNELPKLKDIGSEFQTSLTEVDYFLEISNSDLKGEFNKEKKRVLSSKKNDNGNWGIFSLEGGTSSNINTLLLNIEFIEKELSENYACNSNIYGEFLKLYTRVDNERKRLQNYMIQMQELQRLQNDYNKEYSQFNETKSNKQSELIHITNKVSAEIEVLNEKNNLINEDIARLTNQLEQAKINIANAERNFAVIQEQKPSLLFIQKIFNRSKIEEYFKRLNTANDTLNNTLEQINIDSQTIESLQIKLKTNSIKITKNNQSIKSANNVYTHWEEQQLLNLQKINSKIAILEKIKLNENISELDLLLDYNNLQKSNPWFSKEYRTLQSELFILALKVRKQFLYENYKHIRSARLIWIKQQDYCNKKNGIQILLEAWQWINFTIPVISTTFASFGRMFRYLPENSISNLFIDEAGQALPQASVGAIFRSKRVTVVGDPSQIKPVLTLDSSILNLIARRYEVDEKYISADASTQSIIDSTSQFGFQKNEDSWIGIPLWVHRRSNYPMFNISNRISYDDLMVQGKDENSAHGICKWYDCTGKANNKFVKEQAELLEKLISEKIEAHPELKEQIYVISPFKNVALQLSKYLDKIKFTKREKNKSINVGTVHTFQGKEAKIVFFILGADSENKGAARWAVNEPNLMNVAATRAKEEFYILGDKRLYSSLGSKVANMTIEIIDEYNGIPLNN